MTEHKHYGIRGSETSTIFGDGIVDTEMYGNKIKIKSTNGDIDIVSPKDVNVSAITNAITCKDFKVDANNGASIKAKNTVVISSDGTANIYADKKLEIISNTDTIRIEASKDVGIKSVNGNAAINAKNNVSITSGNNIDLNCTNLNLKPSSRCTLSSAMYGTSLPGSGVQGQVFFKLIS